jgi:hypothetical protein
MLVDDFSKSRPALRSVDRVRGPSSFAWFRLTMVLLLTWVVLGVATLIATLSRPGSPDAGWFLLYFVLLGAWVVLLVVLFVTVAGSRIQSARELRSGYTDAINTNANAAQIDPRTGVVIREPGAPFLTKDELVAAKQQAREWARSPGR